MQEANFSTTEQQNAVLELAILTGLPEQINKIAKYINKDFNKDLLKEFKLISHEDKIEYLKENEIEKTFSFVGKEISEEDFINVLVVFAQSNWFGKTGENWVQKSDLKKEFKYDGSEKIKELVNKTGIFEDTKFSSENKKYFAILGATIPVIESRFRFAINSIGEKILEDKEIYFLVGIRFLNENEVKIQGVLETVQKMFEDKNNKFGNIKYPKTKEELTETHGAMFVLNKINEERKVQNEKPIKVNFVDTSKTLNFEEIYFCTENNIKIPNYVEMDKEKERRPNTEATVRQFLIDTLDKDIKIDDVIFVSDGINKKVQEIGIERVCIENDIKFNKISVIGEFKEDIINNKKFSDIANNLASRIFAVYPRLSNCDDDKIVKDKKYESKTRESFRERVLSNRSKQLNNFSKTLL